MYSLNQEFLWTENGQHRVAAVISATLRFNREQRIKPKSVRSLARLAGYENHTSIGDYARGKVGNPNRNNCQVLKDYAKYIYRVDRFDVRGNGVDRFVRVEHQRPNFKLDDPYWEQPGVTYADSWVDLLQLGTIAGDAFENRVDEADHATPAASLILRQIKQMQPGAVPFIARGLEIPVSVIAALRGEQVDMEKREFKTLGQVIQDFLVRTNEIKTEPWSLDRLASAILQDAIAIEVSRLKQLIQEVPPTEGECMFLSSTFKRYGVQWETRELLELGFTGIPRQGSLIENDEHQHSTK